MLSFLFAFVTTAQALQGGSYVEQERFPGTIAFFLSKASTQEQCTAVHVAPNIFLTAAHCFDRYEKDGSSPLITFVANEMGEKSEPRIVTFARRLVRAPVIHPDYYKTDGFFGSFRNTHWGSDPDLALIKVDEDIDELSIAKIATTDYHVGQALMIGGFGPEHVGKTCAPQPCSIRMGVAKITEVTSQELLIDSDATFLTDGDAGGPAYEIRGKNLVVVAINQSRDKVTRLTKIDQAWYRANLERLEAGRK